jgi:hypothetical protein
LSFPGQHMNIETAIVAAAIGSRQSYTEVARAVAEYQQSGLSPLPGTMAHDAITAWRAATHAISECAKKQGKARRGGER